MITAYYLCHGHWTVIPHQLEENFADMADCGFTAVAMSFDEGELAYARRGFEKQIALAKKRGLRCLVIPSRLGGRFAGTPFAPSMWLVTHPHCQVPDLPMWPMACVEPEEFVDWVTGFMTTLVTDYDLDGIIWDEPKRAAVVSHHPNTLRRYGPEPTPEQMEDGFVELLAGLTAHCLSIKPGLSVTVMMDTSGVNSEHFTDRACAILGIEYFGYDGPVSRGSRFHEKPSWMGIRIESAWERTVSECSRHGKKTYALIESFMMPASVMPEFESNLEQYLRNCKPDHLAIYYYGANNEAPEAVQEVTHRLMRKYL